MNPSEFEHPPLGHIVEGLTDANDLSAHEIKAILNEKGCAPEALAARLKARVRELSRESRLGWLQKGEAIQARLQTALRTRHSWVNRKAEEINAAFSAVVAGHYGSQGQLQVNSAFNNLTNVSLESKAQFLDEVDMLLAMKSPPTEPPTSP